MKVLFFFDEDDKYGAPKSGMGLVRELKNKYGVIPIVLTSKRNNVNMLCDKEKIENYVTHHHKYVYVETNSFKSKIKLVPRYFRYKLGNIIARFVIPRKINLKEIDMIHTNISGIDIGILIAKKYNILNIVHIREFGDLDFNMKSYRKKYINFLNNNVDRFIAISDAVKQYWIKKGIQKKKIVTVYNGIDTLGIAKKDNYDNKKLRIIMLGSISEGKGQTELVEAIGKIDKKILSNIDVNIIGSGYFENEEKLRRLIDDLKLGNIVKFKTYDSEIQKKLCTYDIGVVCSKSEGFGRVTVEYMTSSLAVIVSNTGANEEIIDNNKNGLVYEKGNILELSEKIVYLYNNKNKRIELGNNAREKALKLYNISVCADKIFKIYNELNKNCRK